MNNSREPDDHSPIKVLYDKIIENFYYRNNTITIRLSDYRLQGLIDPAIFFDPSTIGIKTPYVNLITRQITVPKSFLTYLWCIVYSFINIIEKGLPSSIYKTDQSRVLNSEEFEMMKTANLLGWALSLRTESSLWPSEFPKPCDKSLEVRKTNIIFLDAIAFIMYHEVAHVANGHWNFYQSIVGRKTSELSNEEMFTLKAIETEADNFAYDCLIGSDDTEESRYHKSLAVHISILANLYLIKDLSDLNQYKHLDPDIRIYNLLHRETFSDPGYQFHTFNTFNLGVSLFLHINKLPYLEILDNIDSYDEILEHLFNVIQKEKMRYQQ